MTVSKYEQAQRAATKILADTIHATPPGGSTKPVTDLYHILVAAGRHEIITEPRRA